jgi:hypothetical protein
VLALAGIRRRVVHIEVKNTDYSIPLCGTLFFPPVPRLPPRNNLKKSEYKLNDFEDLYLNNGSDQDQNLELTVSCMPTSLDGGRGDGLRPGHAEEVQRRPPVARLSRIKPPFSGPCLALARTGIRRFVVQIEAMDTDDLIPFAETVIFRDMHESCSATHPI